MKTKLSGKLYADFNWFLKRNNTKTPNTIATAGIINPDVNESLNSSLFSLKKSTLVEWMIPSDKKGMKIKIELVSKLSNPFSSTPMYVGFE